MVRLQLLAGVMLITLSMSLPALAQEESESAPEASGTMERITPVDQSGDAAILTTHAPEENAVSESKKLPWQKTTPPVTDEGLVQPAPVPAPMSLPGTSPLRPPVATYQQKVPFGHAEPVAPAPPSGPHSATAVPVEDVDAVETSEPAPATPTPNAADPAKEDPAAPTELTSPIFAASPNDILPRKIVIRALNKVTAQSELIEAKPGETVKFGRLEITAVTCRASLPTSQTDYAGLLDISEHQLDKEGLKPLYRGWMYASSPSIASLEHPVYDVMMVLCKEAVPAAKAEDKPAKAPAKKAKK